MCVHLRVTHPYLTRGRTQWHRWGKGRFGVDSHSLVWTERSGYVSAVGCRDESARHTENGSSSPKPRSHPPIRRLHAKPSTCIISHTDNCVISCSARCNPWSFYIVISLLFDTDKKIKLLITLPNIIQNYTAVADGDNITIIFYELIVPSLCK